MQINIKIKYLCWLKNNIKQRLEFFMKRIAVIIEVTDKKWDGLCDILQKSLDESNSDLRVTEYQTYEENETFLIL